MKEIVSRDKNNKLVYTYIVQTKTMLAFTSSRRKIQHLSELDNYHRND